MTKRKYERGSEWRQWDLHVHSPASFHWGGVRFEPGGIDSEKNRELIDEMIAALNQAKPAVYAVMDYWTFDGWFALKKRLKEAGSPQLHNIPRYRIEIGSAHDLPVECPCFVF